jgi:ribosomal protein L11 methyltransferase
VDAFTVAVPPSDEDAATAILWELGTSGIEVRTAADETVLSAYFPAGAVSLAEVARALGVLPGARVEPAEVLVVDWTARFKESFRAFRAGSFLIVPAWERDAPGEGRRIVVDPGLAFGTGTHESTRLALAALESLSSTVSPPRVLDVGAGSGILSIAALILGAGVAVAVEIDPDALPAARDHAALNGAAVRFVRGDGARCVREGAFDVVLANISAPLLIARAAEIAAACRPGGHVVLAGFLRYDIADVRAAYEAEAASIHVRIEGEWASLVVARRA